MPLAQTPPSPDVSFGAGFRAGFPVTTFGSPIVDDPTMGYLGGKLTGNVAGVAAGGAPAFVSYQIYSWASEAPRSSVKSAARYASLGTMIAGAAVAGLGALGAVSTVMDLSGSLGLSTSQ